MVRAVADARLVADLQTAADALQAEASTLETSRRDRGVFFEVQSASGRKRESAVYRARSRKVTSPSKRHVAFRRMVDSEAVAAVAAELSRRPGNPLVCGGPDRLPNRPASAAGFRGTKTRVSSNPSRASVSTHGGVNVVVALSASDVDNGGFAVLGGTHVRGEARARSGTPTTPPASSDALGLFDESKRVVPALDPGDAVFFHPLLAQGEADRTNPGEGRVATLWCVSRGET